MIEAKLPKNCKDESGKRFGRWTVLAFHHSSAKVTYWLCRCDCGAEKAVAGRTLRSGDSRSCGCLKDELSAARCIESKTTHGQAARTAAGKYTPEYRAWLHLRERCSNPANKMYHRYGGRGINVCAEWQSSFEEFFAYVGRRPSSAHSIDRFPNNDGNYEPGNVRWATKQQQLRNYCRNRLVEFRGVTRPLCEWVEAFSLPRLVTLKRLNRGWTAEKAFFQPPMLNQFRAK